MNRTKTTSIPAEANTVTYKQEVCCLLKIGMFLSLKYTFSVWEYC